MLTEQFLTLEDVTLAFGASNQSLLNRLSFSMGDGEIACLLGGSGCGKTSLLRLIAGLLPCSSGRVTLDGQLIESADVCLPANERGVGMVFQDYALFPHLTVRDNIAFGLKALASGQSKHWIDERVDECINLVTLQDQQHKFPHQLSGGQQQRVAIARAIAPRPKLLLLDEPFAHLDVHLRESLARELRALLKNYGICSLMVTHDQQEAFAFADTIGVMSHGRIEQWGSAQDLYYRPANRMVADFIGDSLIIPAEMSPRGLRTDLGTFDLKFAGNAQVGHLMFRPNAFSVSNQGRFEAVVLDQIFRGSYSLLRVKLHQHQGAHELYIELVDTVTYAPGDSIQLNVLERQLVTI